MNIVSKVIQYNYISYTATLNDSRYSKAVCLLMKIIIMVIWHAALIWQTKIIINRCTVCGNKQFLIFIDKSQTKGNIHLLIIITVLISSFHCMYNCCF